MGSILELFSGKRACRLLVKADGAVLEKYRQFREFLAHNHDALSLVAELEQLSGIEQLSGVRPRDVSRFVADDLERTLQVAVPFSPMLVYVPWV